MKRILFLLLLFLNTSLFSQKIIWQKTIGGNDTDWCSFLEPTKDGNFISGGYSYSNISGDKTENSRGDGDFWIYKINNSSGELLWQKTIGGNQFDHITSAKETSDGGFILGGYSSSNISGEKTENSRGYDDFWVVKLDTNRNIIWNKTYGGSKIDRIEYVIETKDGGYLLGGNSDSNISGDKTENSFGNIDIWIIKVDRNGQINWQKTYGGNNVDNLAQIAITPDDNYILAGYSSSNISGNKTQNTKGIGDYWILKIDTKGSIIWQNTIGGNNMDTAKSLVITPEGDYVIGGYSFSNISGDKTENTVNKSVDIWLTKLNDSGQLISQKNLGADSLDDLIDLRITKDNGYIIGSTTFSGVSGIKTEPHQGDRDYWAIKLDSKFNVEWDKTFGGSYLDQPTSIVETIDGKYIMAGWSRSDKSGDKSEDKKGFQDIWTIKFEMCPKLPPLTISSQTFCVQQNATLSNIAITGQNIKWYDALTAGTLLPNTTVLQDGKSYYASQTINGCESNRIPVAIAIQNTLSPTGVATQSFCSSQNPTIANIQISGTSIKWYDATNNGTLLAETTSLQNGKTYYASQTLTNCESPRFGVTISIVNTPTAPTVNGNQAFCKSQNATLDHIQISGQNIKWYESSTSTNILPNTTLLENNKTYYASQTVGCESARTAVSIQINDVALPTGSNSQLFCIDENATIANLNLTGNNLKWYDLAVNGTILPETTLLQNGIYYATQTLNNCESERFAISVKIQDTQIPIADSPQVFCIQKNALIRDIDIKGQNIKWFGSDTSSISLEGSTLLANGITYYASQIINNCQSPRIPVVVNILNATTSDCINLVDQLPYPKFFTPNGDGYNDTWSIDFAYLKSGTHIRIFDRYGKLIKELTPNTSWDGTYQNLLLPSTDYWFVVTRSNGAEFKAHFSLKR